LFDLARKALFTTPPETAHELALESLRLAQRSGALGLLCKPLSAPVQVMGLGFANPVGLAAGMDKNGDYIDALGALGFGFIEVGTVTPRPQSGNPKPRVFRLPQAGAMINRLGFNNKGVDYLVQQVKQRQYDGVLGINIGKNFDTPNERAVEDYLHCFNKVYAHADYITINISSPNTKGLRDLQETQALDGLLGALAEARRQLADDSGRRVPIAVKLAPDLTAESLGMMAEHIAAHEMDAVIATNTTIDRDSVSGLEHAEETGGLSGQPVFEKSNKALRRLRAVLPAHIALIGVGGIGSGEQAARKVDLGADLVQFYTGFVYAGPGLIGDCVRAIRARPGGA
jgi:dihydroorotate dehydrogenase